MSRRSSSRREFSIPGDELEQHRIQLEHNLQNTDLSLHLSSGPDDDGNNDSVEYPRHNSAPAGVSGLMSFDQHSRENLDLDASQLHAWSIHDDEGITPYDVRTMSTAAHHASAVTITAGLRRGARREPSFSGAEYDPERPLQDILAACNAQSESDEADKPQDTSRSKLSESLHRVGFSPRRPRNVQSQSSQHAAQPTSARKSTPSTASKFTKMARGLTRDIRQAQDLESVPPAAPVPRKSNRSRIYLPDVTGLTNAAISPAKAHLERHSIRGSGSKEVEARLIASLNALHARLNHLETDNSIARRRVRELEFELEECKRDVIRERTRIMDSHDARGKETKQKEAGKYFEVVEEKKALEALIATLRTHLSRVTSDLSSQQQLLDELRRLRESDALSLTVKTQEINQLRTEVERLAGEIEVLRSIVEEGLNERRQGRDQLPNEQNASVESPKPRRFIDDDELDRISIELDERRSERLSNSSANPSLDVSADPDEPRSSRLSQPSANLEEEVSAELHERRSERLPSSHSNPPFPKIASGRMERLFFSAPRHNRHSCRMCNGHRSHSLGDPNPRIERLDGRDEEPPREMNRERARTLEEILETIDRNGGKFRSGDLPPQTVLARVVGELEDEFSHFREIYGGLAEEYRGIDSATQSAERRLIGDHLRDVIEVLERKGNQISSLYDLLVFKDKPIE